MKKLIKIFLLCLILNSCFLILVSFSPVFAQNEFLSSYNISYQIFQNGNTLVTQNTQVKNLTSDFQAVSYEISIKSLSIKNIKAFDKLGPLNVSVKKSDLETKITVSFNEKAAGINNILNWTLSYEVAGYAHKNGQIWEVLLPGPPQDSNLGDYNISLVVPKSFSTPLYLSPPSSQSYFWTKEEIGKSGIYGIFGKNQLFDFVLNYHLKNEKDYEIVTEIALPPDTPYQKISLKKLDPEPENVTLDTDGNWMALYHLKPHEDINVKAVGLVQLFFTPQKKVILTAEEQKIYTSPNLYWEVNDPQIKSLSQSLKTPQAIYDFVVHNLTYDYSKIKLEKVKRMGAKKVLNNKDKAICMEFTDLFIALARSAGIPARELDGFAYTTNQKLQPLSLERDILHSWPEYYDEKQQTWISVDPTWENTTQGIDYFHKWDLNHFVFTIRGQNSEYPYPAGSYKKDVSQKDLLIGLSLEENFTPQKNQEVLKLAFPPTIISGLSSQGSITVYNNTGVLLDSDILNIIFFNLKSKSNQKLEIEPLPPYGSKIIKVNFSSHQFWQKGVGTINIYYQKKLSQQKIKILPFIYYDKFQKLIGGIIVLFTLFIIAQKTRRLLIQRRLAKNPLCGKS